MKIRKFLNNRTARTVLQGLLLLVILSALFSVCINLALYNLPDQQGSDQPALSLTPEQEKELVESLADMQNHKGSLQFLSIAMYAAFALLFLLRALSARETWKPSRLRYGIGSLLFTACAGIFLLRNSDKACGLAAVLHAAALITDHIFSIVKNHKARNVAMRVIFILVILLSLTLIIISGRIALLYILLVTVPRIFYYIAQIAFSRVKLDVLNKIVRKTYAAEILFGMLMLIVAFSIVLPQFEEGIPTFSDALWYCFAIVTTIGFGDFTAATIPGRAISIILGCYGIIVVALITSIIVNFYGETKNDADPAEADEPELPEP